MMTINPMPSPTWHHLGVNDAGKKLSDLPWDSAAPASWNVSGSPYATLTNPSFDMPGALGAAFEETMQLSHHVASFILNGHSEVPIVLASEQVREQEASVIEIEALKGAEATVVLTVTAQAQFGYAVHLHLHPDARIHLVAVHFSGKQASVFGSVGALLEEHAQLELTRIDTGGHIACSGARVLLNGQQSQFHLHAMYIGTDQQTLDFNDLAEHRGIFTQSAMQTAGILDDQASKILRGTIDFRRGSVHSRGKETEDVLLLSPSVRNRTAPVILCSEEQVDGQHAASIGRISQDQMLYCQSRGMDENTARKLLAFARLRPIIDTIDDAALREQILKVVEERLKKHA